MVLTPCIIIVHIILISGIELNWKESFGGKVTRISEPDLPDGVVEKISLTVKVNKSDSVVYETLNSSSSITQYYT